MLALVVAQEILVILAQVVIQAPPVTAGSRGNGGSAGFGGGGGGENAEAHEAGVILAETRIILEVGVLQETHETLLQMSQTVKRVEEEVSEIPDRR